MEFEEYVVSLIGRNFSVASLFKGFGNVNFNSEALSKNTTGNFI